MKKYFLFIPVFICFLSAIAGAGNSAAQNPAGASVSTNNLYTVLTANYPHTEFEVNDHVISVNSGCRHQSQQNLVTGGESFSKIFHAKTLLINEVSSNTSSKRYLAHIYPSHNFW